MNGTLHYLYVSGNRRPIRLLPRAIFWLSALGVTVAVYWNCAVSQPASPPQQILSASRRASMNSRRANEAAWNVIKSVFLILIVGMSLSLMRALRPVICLRIGESIDGSRE